MSFVAAFYSFNVNLTKSDEGLYSTFRFKTARHPYESDEYFTARLLAFLHSYEEKMTFSQGVYAPEEPTIWKHNEIEQVTRWIEVGNLDEKKLKSALKLATREQVSTRFRSYFFDTSQVSEFCAELKGSKTNWVESVEFFLIESTELEDLLSSQKSNASLSATVLDDEMFLSVEAAEARVKFRRLDIWREYQAALGD